MDYAKIKDNASYGKILNSTEVGVASLECIMHFDLKLLACMHFGNQLSEANVVLYQNLGDVANSKRPLFIIPKVQLRLRVTRRSATALARYPQKLAKIVCG